MTLKKAITALSLSLCVSGAFATGVAANELVTNGGFETGTF